MRLFVGLDLPSEMREPLALLCRGLGPVRWVPAANYHLTLRFIGEVAPDRAEEVDFALASLRVPGFPLRLGGLGVFERNGRIASLWAGVDRHPGLDRLQAKIETALQRAGLPAERRRFSPHVSLARLESPLTPTIAAWLQANNLFRTPEAAIRHFTLFRSYLGKLHPTYTVEAEYALESTFIPS